MTEHTCESCIEWNGNTGNDPCYKCKHNIALNDYWKPKKRTDFSTEYHNIEIMGTTISLINKRRLTKHLMIYSQEIRNLRDACNEALGED